MRKLQTFWQNLHLRAKFLLILLVGIVIIGVDAIATLLIPLRAYDEQLYESSSQMISLYAEQIKHEMKNYEDISYRILTDSSLQENLAIIKDASPARWPGLRHSATSPAARRITAYGSPTRSAFSCARRGASHTATFSGRPAARTS